MIKKKFVFMFLVLAAVSAIVIAAYPAWMEFRLVASVANENGFALTEDRVNLGDFADEGFSGRINATYMTEEESEKFEVFYLEGHYKIGEKFPPKNCYLSSDFRRDFWAYRVKERLGVRGRKYTSFFEHGDRLFFLDGRVVFEVDGTTYVSATDFEEIMREVCGTADFG